MEHLTKLAAWGCMLWKTEKKDFQDAEETLCCRFMCNKPIVVKTFLYLNFIHLNCNWDISSFSFDFLCCGEAVALLHSCLVEAPLSFLYQVCHSLILDPHIMNIDYS